MARQPPVKRELRFSAELLNDDPTMNKAFIAIPPDVMAVFAPAKRVPVAGTVNGFPFRGSIVTMAGEPCLGVNAQMRAGARAAVGDVAEFVVARDTEERVVDVPADLLAAMSAREREQFAAFSYTHQKEYVRAIEDAKKPETRLRRIAATVDAVRKKLRT
jgi:hypothetical protein